MAKDTGDYGYKLVLWEVLMVKKNFFDLVLILRRK